MCLGSLTSSSPPPPAALCLRGLPPNVRCEVLAQLAARSDALKRACRCVSSEARQAVDAHVQGLQADLPELLAHIADPCMPLRLPELRRLALRARGADATVCQLLRQLCGAGSGLQLSKLEALDLSRCGRFDAGALAAVLAACPALQTLELPPTIVGVRSAHAPRWGSEAEGDAGEEGLFRILRQHAQQLQHLLQAGPYVTRECVRDLCALTNLRTLDVGTEDTQLQVPPGWPAQLSALRALQQLSVGGADLEGGCRLAATLPALSSLEFSADERCCVLANAAAEGGAGNASPAAAALAQLQGADSLRRLSLHAVADDAMLRALGGVRGLQRLQLSCCTCFTATPSAAAALRGRLQHLDISIDGEHADALAAALPLLGAGLASLVLSVFKTGGQDCSRLLAAVFSLPRLEQLTLKANYYGLVGADVARLPPLAPALAAVPGATAPEAPPAQQRLDRAVSGGEQHGSQQQRQHAEPQPPQRQRLRELTLSNHFDDGALCRILSCAPGLQRLRLCGCGEVTAVGLTGVLKACRDLQSAELRFCRQVDFPGVACLARGHAMQRIVVEACRRVSRDCCAALRQCAARPDMEAQWLP